MSKFFYYKNNACCCCCSNAVVYCMYSLYPSIFTRVTKKRTSWLLHGAPLLLQQQQQQCGQGSLHCKLQQPALIPITSIHQIGTIKSTVLTVYTQMLLHLITFYIIVYIQKNMYGAHMFSYNETCNYMRKDKKCWNLYFS